MTFAQALHINIPLVHSFENKFFIVIVASDRALSAFIFDKAAQPPGGSCFATIFLARPGIELLSLSQQRACVSCRKLATAQQISISSEGRKPEGVGTPSGFPNLAATCSRSAQTFQSGPYMQKLLRPGLSPRAEDFQSTKPEPSGVRRGEHNSRNFGEPAILAALQRRSPAIISYVPGNERFS